MHLVHNHNVFIWTVILLYMLRETNFLNKYLADVKPSEINIFSQISIIRYNYGKRSAYLNKCQEHIRLE